MIKYEALLKGHFKEKSFVDSNLESFNNFVDFELQSIIDDLGDIEPTIIPHNIDDFKIRFDKIWVEKPKIIEADGSERDIYPVEARLRKISYAAAIMMEISAHINGIQRESFVTQIGSLPIMLKSKYCHLYNKNRDELISNGEDPDDLGGYFIVNGIEKALIIVEDLASNRLVVEKSGTAKGDYIGKLFSEEGFYKIPHTFETNKDLIYTLSFTRVKKVELFAVIKALGMIKDEEIVKTISVPKYTDNLMINLLDTVELKTQEDALDYIAKKIGITQTREIRVEKIQDVLDKYLLPHVGTNKNARMAKAINLCKLVKKYILVANEEIPEDDKDHYANKRLKLSGDLLADLIRVNLRVLIDDLLYNFQRIVKRGKFPSIKVIIRDKLLTSRIYSSMATGNWIGGRKGISQRIQRLNFNETMSHLQRVVSPLSTSQENFEARSLHCTHEGRLCPMETPEGTNIGLRKNLAMLASISQAESDDTTLDKLKGLGLNTI
ncbi:DNA-directed RNA polymerase subunit B'' [Candidatus Woesearchaeota archaeon]|nr:DNA-directed RNA polymerase subunit B'' [Candidatus Woesearchaeota archaeon]